MTAAPAFTGKFQLDTSGVVVLPPTSAARHPSPMPLMWHHLDSFTQGYVEALLRSVRPTFYRIREGVKPYGGKRLKVAYRAFLPGTDTLAEVTGYVHVSASKVATAQRLYRADELEAEPLGFRHLAPETLARIVEDCAGQAKVYTDRRPDRVDGEIFWDARQNWRLAQTFPPLTPQLGDDGKVYLRDAAVSA